MPRNTHEKMYIWPMRYLKKQKEDGRDENDEKILSEMEIPLMQVLKDMELYGIKIDRDRLKWIGTLLENECRDLEKEIYSLSGEEV